LSEVEGREWRGASEGVSVIYCLAHLLSIIYCLAPSVICYLLSYPVATLEADRRVGRIISVPLLSPPEHLKPAVYACCEYFEAAVVKEHRVLRAGVGCSEDGRHVPSVHGVIRPEANAWIQDRPVTCQYQYQ
jgi:hypothetical protein